ncbi:hypothetical protein O181_111951 [Austropuccinia psidii MF-1]|uniref:Uncharacterized protein n=1 Tax=Austropuccinia psidii MF-1 TaxID=1389203 RepID=A0A9Q3K1F9_9BASI|nr:hypothetical protein [Austropuccinia psidii MF-1]
MENQYLNYHFLKWEEELIPKKVRKFKNELGKANSLRTIIKDIILPHDKANIRLKPEFVFLKNEQLQGFLLGTESQRMCFMYISNSKNIYLTIGTNKHKKASFDINNMKNVKIPIELLEDFKEAQYGTKLTIKFKGNYIELYLGVERPNSPMLRRPPYPESLETRKEIEKKINEPLEVGLIRKIGHNERREVTTPVLIAFNDGKYRFCGDFKALNNYAKEDR